MAKRRDIDRLRDKVGTFDAPIGTVQLPETGVRYDKRGNPKPLQSGQDEHADAPAREPGQRRKRKQPEPELAFSTDAFLGDPAERAALTTCHKVLAGKLVTTKQLRDKLVAAEHEPEMIEFAIERCRVNGLLDDVRYTDMWVESRVRRGHGARRIHQDLAQRGVDRAMVDAALAQYVDDGGLDAGAVDAARKKARRMDLEDRAVQAKLQRWLLGRGYSGAQANAALRAVRAEHAAESDDDA